jgi:hypothetical protein
MPGTFIINVVNGNDNSLGWTNQVCEVVERSEPIFRIKKRINNLNSGNKESPA